MFIEWEDLTNWELRSSEISWQPQRISLLRSLNFFRILLR